MNHQTKSKLMYPTQFFARENLLSQNTDKNWRPPPQQIPDKKSYPLFSHMENPLQSLLLNGDNTYSYYKAFSFLLNKK